MSLKNKKAARPDGTQADGIDKEESINSVCEQNSATRDKCQGGPRSGKTAATIQILTENFNIARRAVHIAAVIMNADGLCRYDSVEKMQEGVAAGQQDLREVYRKVAAGQGEKGTAECLTMRSKP